MLPPSGTRERRRLPDDAEIALAVRRALARHPQVPADRIAVTVHSGVVTLRGNVDRWHEWRSAAEAATELLGVVAVRNEVLVVRPATSDADLLAEVRHALRRRIGDRADGLDLATRAGVVWLAGAVRSPDERARAEHAAWSVRGVRAVVDRLSLTP